MATETSCCEDRHLCVCEKPTNSTRNSHKETELDIPLVTENCHEKTEVEFALFAKNCCKETEVEVPLFTGNCHNETEAEIPLFAKNCCKETEVEVPLSAKNCCKETEVEVPLFTGNGHNETEEEVPLFTENNHKKTEVEIPVLKHPKIMLYKLKKQIESVRYQKEIKNRKLREQVETVHSSQKEVKKRRQSSCSGNGNSKSNYAASECENVNVKHGSSPSIQNMPNKTDLNNHRKKRGKREKKNGVKRQRTSSPVRFKSTERSKSIADLTHEGKETPTDLLNLSLPTPKHSSCTLEDSTMEEDGEKSESDSDDDLPVGLTPVRYSNNLQEKDLVWVKWKKWPHIPALVKHVYKKKKKVTLVTFQPEGQPSEQFTIHISSNVFSFFDPRKENIMKNSGNLPVEEFNYFNACVKRAEEYLMKKALKELDDDWSFFRDENFIEGFKEEEDEESFLQEEQESSSRAPDTDKGSEVEPVKKIRGLSKRGLLRKEKLKEKTKELTKFLISDDCKDYLYKIFKKEIKSEKHQLFMTSSSREKIALKYQGFGPIDDEDQLDDIFLTYYNWLKDINENPNISMNSYVLDVWIPEAVVFGLKKLKKYSTKKAWEVFHKGVRSTKEELQLVHEQVIRKSPEGVTEDRRPLFKPKKLILKP